MRVSRIPTQAMWTLDGEAVRPGRKWLDGAGGLCPGGARLNRIDRHGLVGSGLGSHRLARGRPGRVSSSLNGRRGKRLSAALDRREGGCGTTLARVALLSDW